MPILDNHIIMFCRKQLFYLVIISPATVFVLNLYVAQKTIIEQPSVYNQLHSSSSSFPDYLNENYDQTDESSEQWNSNTKLKYGLYSHGANTKVHPTKKNNWSNLNPFGDTSENYEISPNYGNEIRPYDNDDRTKQAILRPGYNPVLIESRESKVAVYSSQDGEDSLIQTPEERNSETFVSNRQPDKFVSLIPTPAKLTNEGISTTRVYHDGRNSLYNAFFKGNYSNTVGAKPNRVTSISKDKPSIFNILKGHPIFKDYVKMFREGYDELFYTIHPVSVGVSERQLISDSSSSLRKASSQLPDLGRSDAPQEIYTGNFTVNGDVAVQNDSVTFLESYKIPGCKCLRKLPSIKQTPEYVELRRISGQQTSVRNVQKISSCSDHATARGAGQKVVSYSYFGNTSDPGLYDRYFSEIPLRAREVQHLYPGMVMRVYHNVGTNDRRGQEELCRSFCDFPHLDICDVTALPSPWNNFGAKQKVGTLWRFLTLLDPLVDVTLLRDLDSYVLPREVAAVEEWLASDVPYHVMRDHPLHNGFILAGLWGSQTNFDRANAYHNGALMLSQPYNDLWDYDQRLLRRILWPTILDQTVIHDSYTCKVPMLQGRRPSRPFPTQRDGRNYTGYGRTKMEATKLLIDCPLICRPKSHQDWLLC